MSSNVSPIKAPYVFTSTSAFADLPNRATRSYCLSITQRAMRQYSECDCHPRHRHQGYFLHHRPFYLLAVHIWVTGCLSEPHDRRRLLPTSLCFSNQDMELRISYLVMHSTAGSAICYHASGGMYPAFSIATSLLFTRQFFSLSMLSNSFRLYHIA